MAFPSFSTPQQQQQQQQQQPSMFQQNNLFSQQQQQQQQQQLFLFTNEKVPATYGTKWADLHPDSQKILLQIEGQVLEYRDESQRLDQCSRLHDSSLSNDGFELDTSHVNQELGGIGTVMEREKAVLHELMVVAKDMLRNTEVAVRSFMILRPRFLHPKPPVETTPVVETVFDFYCGLPKKPSPFMVQTVARFGKYLGDCRQWIEELEQLLLLDSETTSSSSLLQSLPKVILNVHHFFVHVAAKVEMIHQYIESMKMAYLADQKRRGDGNNPFLEADRRETAKQEAAAKRVHPTLHLPAPTQVATAPGLFATPSTFPSQTSSSSAAAAAGTSIFGTTSSAPYTAAATSLFATPAATSAPASSIFGASPQTPVFGTALTGSLFGSASTPSLFPTPAPSFGNTASAAGSSLFSTPFATAGAPTGLGQSFGAASKQSRPKTRTSRR